jgi:hypothetical protein
MLKTIKSIWFFFCESEKEELEKIDEERYKKEFIEGRTDAQIEATYKKAWETRNFEIDLYWKRATYFWAFQIASFTAYFAVLNSKNFESMPPKYPQILFIVTCIGFITAMAWALINKGSKTWQRHWEIHIDMLEDKITGPLYKIVTQSKTFSVSKINEIVSRFIVIVWLMLGIKYFSDYLTFKSTSTNQIDWFIVFTCLTTFYFTGAMFWGHGRGRFGKRQVTFYKRKFDVTK